MTNEERSRMAQETYDIAKGGRKKSRANGQKYHVGQRVMISNDLVGQ